MSSSEIAPDEDGTLAQPVAALTALRSSLSTITSIEQLDDTNALELRRLAQLWERRLHRPVKWLIFAIPAGCTGLSFVEIDLVQVSFVLFALTMVAGFVVVPLTAGLLREESHQRGVGARALRQLQRLDINTRIGAKTDEAFLLVLEAARQRERLHRERPTIFSTLRRALFGP